MESAEREQARQCAVGSSCSTSTRAIREREVAAYHRECAALAWSQASIAAPADRPRFWQAEAAHNEIAMLHERLADVYEREDANVPRSAVNAG